uniref:Uncharacterized protein n=1 Tax=Rhipicephalus zambeziensis TaxID=60191 RepID=A0A224YH68_9ACAR
MFLKKDLQHIYSTTGRRINTEGDYQLAFFSHSLVPKYLPVINEILLAGVCHRNTAAAYVIMVPFYYLTRRLRIYTARFGYQLSISYFQTRKADPCSKFFGSFAVHNNRYLMSLKKKGYVISSLLFFAFRSSAVFVTPIWHSSCRHCFRITGRRCDTYV